MNLLQLNYQIEDPGLTLKGISQCENLKKNIHMNNKFSDVELSSLKDQIKQF